MASKSNRLAAFASVGGLFVLGALAVVEQLEQPRLIVFLTFLFMLGVAPAVSAALVYLREQGKVMRVATRSVGLVVVKWLLLGSLITLMASTLSKSRIWPQAVPSWAPTVVLLMSAAAIIIRIASRRYSWKAWQESSDRLDAYLVVAVAIAVFLLSPFDPASSVPVGLLRYALDAPRFGYWMMLGIVWTFAGIWLRRREGWAFPHKQRLLESLGALAVSLVILGLYDDGHFVDYAHYSPVVGPAMHATRGGIPMVDTYSVYGFLPWFIHRLAFAVFQPTFGTAAVVVRILNLAYFAVILSILLCVTRRRLSALWFFLPALLVAVTSHNPGPDGMWNMNALPMTLGGRWLLPAIMTLLLIATPNRNWALWAELALVALASLSSIEILAFTLAPWGYCLLVDSVRSRSIGRLLRRIALACAAIAGAQAAFVALVYLSTGSVVNYEPYFSVFAQYQPSEDSIWSAQFVPGYALWVPVGFSYFLIMAEAIYRALRREPADSLVERLLPVAALGLGPLAYFFGRPQEGTLNIACTTFAVVAIATAQVLFVNARRYGPVGPALSATIALAFAFIIADGFEHFMRPLDPSRGNATILRRCFTKEGCQLASIPGNINLALHTQPLDPRTKVGYYISDSGRRQRIEEAISMLRRLGSNTPYVGMLTDSYNVGYADSDATIGLTSFMATGQWFAWSVSSPINDSSLGIIREIVKRAAKTSSGTLVIISNSFMIGQWSDLAATAPINDGLSSLDTDQVARLATLTGAKLLAAVTSHQRENLLPVNQAILMVLVRRCGFKLLERGRYHSAFLTENCAA